MRTVPKWVNKIHEADKVEFSSVHAICFSPDGSQLVIGAGEKVMVYDPRDGALVQLLQAHKGTVHAVAYCGDGKKFASGSADKNVIIWTSKMEGVLKYSHNEAIQCLAYNPASFHLASCALSDFAFWSAEVKAVQKFRVTGRITSCAWSPNGQFLAIGLASGAVSIRDKTGEETQRITREAAVWAVTFSAATLLVTDWNDTLSFYNLQGQQVSKERNIGISAVSVCTVGGLVAVGGLGGWAVLANEGVTVTATPLDWVWAVAPAPAGDTLAVACQDGTLWCYQLVFSTVHGLYRDRYAYRENMTDVIIQHLTTGTKLRIKCHDKAHKIAVYKRRLAVQLPERVVVYEQGDAEGLLYRVKEKLLQKTECSLLVTTSDCLLLCQDTKLTMIGRRVPKMWTVPAPIRYVKVTTLYLEEVLLLGLLNGQVWLVEPAGGVCRLLLRGAGRVRCLDVSASRARLAVADDASVCRVYSLPDGQLLYTEENVSSVSFNAWCEPLLCLSGGGQLSVKADRFPAAAQPLPGSVVGFQGGRVFCLQANAMQTINVPLSHAMHQYVQHKMFAEAYSVACLGVTAADWEKLGLAALEELSLEVARKAFQRNEDITLLTLIDHLQERLAAGEDRAIVLGTALAHMGRWAAAAASYLSVGARALALRLYTDLRMFHKAQELVVDTEGSVELARQRAEWARHAGEPQAAAMYLACGDVPRAAALLAASSRSTQLIELSRKLELGSSSALRHVAQALEAVGETAAAAAVYTRLLDYKKVAQLAVSAGDWERAFELAAERAEVRRDVYLPYALHCAQQNKFVDAQQAYHMAGETATAMRVFSILVDNAVLEQRYSDASYLHHLLARRCLVSTDNSADSMAEYVHNLWLARVYHAYEAVHRCAHEPFSLSQPDSLLNAARFVLAMIEGKTPPPGVSLFCIYLCIAKQAKALGHIALAKQMLDKMLALKIPLKFQESVELLTLTTLALAGGSADGGALCWRCRRALPPLTPLRCPHCRHAPALALPSYEVLPLVLFRPEPEIPPEEADELLERTEIEPDSTDHLTLQDDGESQLHDIGFEGEGEADGAVICSREALLRVNPSCVVRVTQPPPLPPLLYRNMMRELAVVACPHCAHLMYMEDLEIQEATKGHCPFCRTPRAPPDAASTPGSPTSDDASP